MFGSEEFGRVPKKSLRSEYLRGVQLHQRGCWCAGPFLWRQKKVNLASENGEAQPEKPGVGIPPDLASENGTAGFLC